MSIIDTSDLLADPKAGQKIVSETKAREIKQEMFARWATNKPLFCRQVLNYRTLEPFQVSMLNHNGAVRLGRTIRLRLLPRDSGKSWLGTCADAVHDVCHDPDLRSQIIAEALDTAIMFLSEIKSQFENNHTLNYFYGDHKGDDRAWSAKKIVSKQRRIIAKEATIEAIGAGGAIIGRHVRKQWFDDVVSDKTSDTPEKQSKLVRWYDKTAMPVLEQGGVQNINGTRWYNEDLYGTLLERYGPDILYRVIALEQVPFHLYDEGRNSDFVPVTKRAGDFPGLEHDDFVMRSYFPNRYPADILYALWKANPYTFATQYQNDTNISLSAYINGDKIPFIDYTEWPDFGDLIFFIGVDPAHGEKPGADYFSTCTIGYNEKLGKIYVFRSTMQRLHDPEAMMSCILREWLWVYSQGGSVASVGVESNAFQAILAKMMMNDPQRFGLLPIVERITIKDKVARFIGLIHLFNTGQIIFDEECIALFSDVLKFPDLKHDDRVDSMMHALESLIEATYTGLTLAGSVHDMVTRNAAVIRF